MDVTDQKYILLLGSQLPLFKKSSTNCWRFKCPMCGDSKKNKHKTRGYIFLKDTDYVFYCHNCSTSKRFDQFLRFIDPNLYKQYRFERFKPQQDVIEKPITIQKQVLKTRTADIKLKKISALPHYHPAKKYVVGRMIPPNQHHKLFYVDKFNHWVNQQIPDKIDSGIPDKPRLIIPFVDKDQMMFGFQGRAFDQSEPKYITIILDTDKPKVYGLDTFDSSKPGFLVEGPIDSMFLPNCIAAAGSDFSAIKKYIDKNNCIIALDNEPRNPQICAKILQAIQQQYTVCIWPEDFRFKDINDAELNKITCKSIIENNAYSGLRALAHFNRWKRC